MVATPVRLPLCLLRALQDMVEAGHVWECDDSSQNSSILLFHSYLSRAPKCQHTLRPRLDAEILVPRPERQLTHLPTLEKAITR